MKFKQLKYIIQAYKKHQEHDDALTWRGFSNSWVYGAGKLRLSRGLLVLLGMLILANRN